MRKYKALLEKAHTFAVENSTCEKTQVGAIVFDEKYNATLFINANINEHEPCCRRDRLFGSRSKEHRRHCSMFGFHSEQNIVADMKKHGLSGDGLTLIVTRYPCIHCLTELYAHGFRKIVFGRPYPIEEETKRLIDNLSDPLEIIHIPDWNPDEENTDY